MAISNYIPSSRIAQSGVCTSTTRPASPFEGQMIYETDTNRVLIWDNSAWVMIADTDQPPGLQLVKSQTVGTGVSSVTVTDAFSADYDNYKITYTDGVGSTQTDIRCTLGATTTGYYYSIGISRYDNVGLLAAGGSNSTAWFGIGFTDPIGNLCEFELSMPFLPRKTGIKGWHWDTRTGGGTGFGFSGGHLNNSTSYTSFTLTASSGTMTGGTIRVYGYRN